MQAADGVHQHAERADEHERHVLGSSGIVVVQLCLPDAPGRDGSEREQEHDARAEEVGQRQCTERAEQEQDGTLDGHVVHLGDEEQRRLEEHDAQEQQGAAQPLHVEALHQHVT